jgi:hypothetical protein
MTVEFVRLWADGSWDTDFITLKNDYDSDELNLNTTEIYLLEKGIEEDNIDLVDEQFPGLIQVNIFRTHDTEDFISNLN